MYPYSTRTSVLFVFAGPEEMSTESHSARLVRFLQKLRGRQSTLRAQVLGVLGAETFELLECADQHVQRL